MRVQNRRPVPNAQILVANFLINRNYTTLSNIDNFQLDPWWITGFTDGEGCFSISFVRNIKYKSGWSITLSFSISLQKIDNILLVKIKNYFGVGEISTKHGKQTIKYSVQSIKDLAIIINHFDKYPLKTQKRADFELFKQVVELIQAKEHLTEKGLFKIIYIKASMNNGLSEELEVAFPNITLVQRPVITTNEISDPHWLAGFVEAEGCFSIMILKSQTTKTGFSVILRFQITQKKK